MSGLIERVVRVNGEERQRSQIVYEHGSLDKVIVPVVTVQPPLLTTAEIELELVFDPPLKPVPASAGELKDHEDA